MTLGSELNCAARTYRYVHGAVPTDLVLSVTLVNADLDSLVSIALSCELNFTAETCRSVHVAVRLELI